MFTRWTPWSTNNTNNTTQTQNNVSENTSENMDNDTSDFVVINVADIADVTDVANVTDESKSAVFAESPKLQVKVVEHVIKAEEPTEISMTLLTDVESETQSLLLSTANSAKNKIEELRKEQKKKWDFQPSPVVEVIEVLNDNDGNVEEGQSALEGFIQHLLDEADKMIERVDYEISQINFRLSNLCVFKSH